jgi:hypothetical protein
MNQSNPGWEVWVGPDGNHIIPIGDWMAHSHSKHCSCIPYVDSCLVPPAIVHHAADMREYTEPDHIPGLYEGVSN